MPDPHTAGRAHRAGVPGAALATACAVVVGLLLVSPAYGFHRDELYFIVAGRHPALGYVDQPPLTPLLSAAAVAVLGLSPTAVRILPALSVGVIVLLAALIARELGGTRRSQTLSAVTVALSGLLAAGHLDSTATYDLLAWAVILWLAVRLLAGADPRLWLAVGATAGVDLENKDTVLFLAAGLAVGCVIARRWEVLRSPWLWAGVGVALLLWLPNLAWQAVNGFPQLQMAQAIARSAASNRAAFLPEVILLAGPLLFPITLAGIAWLLRSPRAASWRPVPLAFLAIVALVLLSGGKSYYAVGTYPALMAAGAIVVDGWLDRGRRRLRSASFASGAALSGAIVAVIVLPVLPAATLARTPIPSIYKESGEQIGWPALVSTVRGVVNTLPAGQRGQTVILTGNYGEAGALQLLGSGLPPVYSGHNSYWGWGPPPAGRSTVILVTRWEPAYWLQFFDRCDPAATVDNGLGLQNQEQGVNVVVCSGVREPWATMWPALRHFD